MTQNPMYPPPPPGTPGGAGFGFPQPVQRGNGFAIAGLVVGIAGFCVLFLGGVVGLILGIIGLKKTRNPQVGGRGLSIAAIIVSGISILTSLIFSLTVGGTIWGVARTSAVPRATARTFVQDLTAGNIPAARANADTSITDAELDAMSTQLKSHGTFVDMTAVGVAVEGTPGKKSCSVGGAITLSGGTASFAIELADTGGGWKVTKADFK